MLSGEATNTNFLVFGLTRSGLQPRIYHTRGEHVDHYTTDAVDDFFYKVKISTNYEKIILKLVVLFIALARMGIILSVIRKITLIIMCTFRIKSGMCQGVIIPINPPPLHGSLPRKSLISHVDWVSCAGDINLPHTPFPPARSPPNKKIKYNKILTYILRSIFLEIPHLELPH